MFGISVGLATGSHNLNFRPAVALTVDLWSLPFNVAKQYSPYLPAVKPKFSARPSLGCHPLGGATLNLHAVMSQVAQNRGSSHQQPKLLAPIKFRPRTSAAPTKHHDKLPSTSLKMSRHLFKPLAAIPRQCRPGPIRAALQRPTSLQQLAAPFHTTPRQLKKKTDDPPAQRPRTDFGEMDVLGDVPVPQTAIDHCAPTGFFLDGGVQVVDGSGCCS